MRTCTLLLLLEGDNILLAMKKRGFGAGHWNGVGGKIEGDETIEEALVRECQEEIEVTPQKFQKVAVHDFRFPNGESDMIVHAYTCSQWDGEPVETEEMAPRWFKTSEIPYDKMWADDCYWLPLILAGKKLQTAFTFDSENNLLAYEIEETDTLQ